MPTWVREPPWTFSSTARAALARGPKRPYDVHMDLNLPPGIPQEDLTELYARLAEVLYALERGKVDRVRALLPGLLGQAVRSGLQATDTVTVPDVEATTGTDHRA